jgi:hypothetical protein
MPQSATGYTAQTRRPRYYVKRVLKTIRNEDGEYEAMRFSVVPKSSFDSDAP